MSSLEMYITLGGVVAFVGFVIARTALQKKTLLPAFPEFGALPLEDLGKYYQLPEVPIAWERVRGWDLNAAPATLDAPATIDHVVLMPRLLEFCSSAKGNLELDFNFLVGAIERVEFDPAIVPPGSAPPGHGLLTIYTPSGRTLMVASDAFALALQKAVTHAQSSQR